MIKVSSYDKEGYSREDGCPSPHKGIHARVNNKFGDDFLELFDGRFGLAVHLEVVKRILEEMNDH